MGKAQHSVREQGTGTGEELHPHADRAHAARAGRRPRVLIFEEHFSARRHLPLMLQALDPTCEAYEAGSLSDARRLLETMRIDLLLIDARLVDGAGLAFAGEFRSLHPATPIVLVSAFDATHLRERVKRLGNATFVSKFALGQHWREILADVLARALARDSH